MARKIRIKYAAAASHAMTGGKLNELIGYVGSVSLGRHSRGPALALDSIGRLRGAGIANIVPAQNAKFQAAPQALL